MPAVRAIIEEACRPGHFFVRPELHLVWQPAVEELISWEIFRGHLLDPAHTRQTRAFVAWNIQQLDDAAPSAAPLLSVKLDEATGHIYVVRSILSYVWEGVDVGNNVIESQEIVKWVRELVGTIAVAAYPHTANIADELKYLLGAAVQGTSKLPLTSVEAPLPAFSLGQLAYLPALLSDQPLRHWQDLFTPSSLPLECLLRSLAPNEAAAAARHWVAGFPGQATAIPHLMRPLFTNISLSPYTDVVETALAFVRALVDQGAMPPTEEIDLWAWLLRQLTRHLTAYDLVAFHFRGANYPDALLLDAVLKRYLELIEAMPALFHGAGSGTDGACIRARRRALRQACLIRRHYEGHPVPDAPTSPGENKRVLPPPFVRVPEAQLLNVLRRQKRLYTKENLPDLLSPSTRSVLRTSILDLPVPREWRELGSAVFIDRPLGWGKAVGEPDLTPLLAYEAFSPSLAQKRCREMERLAHDLSLDTLPWEQVRQHENLPVPGLPATQLAEPDRPMVCLADARRVADDFVIRQTLGLGRAELFQVLDFAPLRAITPFPDEQAESLLVRLPAEGKTTKLTWFDCRMRPRLDMVTDLAEGFVTRLGRELPAAGLRVVQVWNEKGEGGPVDIKIRRR